MYGLIYLATNLETRLQYVGQTVKTRDYRWTAHIQKAARGTGDLLHEAIREFGAQSFRLSTLATAESKDELNRLERHFIQALNTQYPNGYNLKAGGSSGKGDKRSPEARANMTAAQLRRGPHKLESRQKMSTAQRARAPASAETLRKRSESLLRYYETHSPPPVSDETRALLSAAARRRKGLSEEGRRSLSEQAAKRNRSELMRQAVSRHARTRTDISRDPKSGRIIYIKNE